MKLSKSEKGFEKQSFSNHLEEQNSYKSSENSPNSQKKILYVEDHVDTAEAVKVMLTDAGFKTETVSSGKEALRKAKEGFDLFLLDIMLPDMSGWDIFKTLKKNIKNTKYIFLSIIPVSTERLKEFKKVGISDYITKPFVKTDLIARVKKALK